MRTWASVHLFIISGSSRMVLSQSSFSCCDLFFCYNLWKKWIYCSTLLSRCYFFFENIQLCLFLLFFSVYTLYYYLINFFLFFSYKHTLLLYEIYYWAPFLNLCMNNYLFSFSCLVIHSYSYLSLLFKYTCCDKFITRRIRWIIDLFPF